MSKIYLHDAPPETTVMGVVRQAVKRSAGRSELMGSSWSLEQAARWIKFLRDGGGRSSAVLA
jgi:hypothetical protein